MIIPYELFREFSLSQILSLLTVKPDFIRIMFSSVEIKEKALNLLLIKLKVVINLF